MPQQVVPIRADGLDAVEVAWFAPLCSDDYRHLGVPEGDLRSSFANTREIVQNVYMRRIEKVDGKLGNIAFHTFEAVPEPWHVREAGK